MDVSLLVLELVLTAGILGVLTWDLWLPKGEKDQLWYVAMAIPVALFLLSFAWTPYNLASADPEGATALSGAFMVDKLALLMKRAFCVTAFLVFVMSRDYVKRLERGQGEFYTLSLAALLGMFLVSSVNDFVALFVSLELITVTFFVLAAFKRDSVKSVEAGIKLLVIGSLSAAILLYGMAFVYGATGSVTFDGVRVALANADNVPPELLIGALLIFIGLGFKTSAVPLHVWVPDVYEGAPTPVTAFLSVGSKMAGFVLVLRCFTLFSSTGPLAAQLTPFFALVAALTLFYGNLGALPQTNIKRLLGYSSIGQCGYILLGIAAASTEGLSGTLFYLCAYVVTNLCAFGVVLLVARAIGSHQLDDYAGLGKRSPLLALALAVAMLSLAGVPPVVGFFGKFMLIGSVFARPELHWLGAVALINVVIALYYYLCVLKRVYVLEPRITETPQVPFRMRFVLTISVALLVGAGLYPGLLESAATATARQLNPAVAVVAPR